MNIVFYRREEKMTDEVDGVAGFNNEIGSSDVGDNTDQLESILEEFDGARDKLEQGIGRLKHKFNQKDDELKHCEIEKLAAIERRDLAETKVNNTEVAKNKSDSTLAICKKDKDKALKDKKNAESAKTKAEGEREGFKKDLVTRTSERDTCISEKGTILEAKEKAESDLVTRTSERDTCVSEKGTTLEAKERTESDLVTRTSERDTCVSEKGTTLEAKEKAERELVTCENDNLRKDLVIKNFSNVQNKIPISLDDSLPGPVKCVHYVNNFYMTMEFNNKLIKASKPSSFYKDLCLKPEGTPDLITCFIGKNYYDLTHVCGEIAGWYDN